MVVCVVYSLEAPQDTQGQLGSVCSIITGRLLAEQQHSMSIFRQKQRPMCRGNLEVWVVEASEAHRQSSSTVGQYFC